MNRRILAFQNAPEHFHGQRQVAGMNHRRERFAQPVGARKSADGLDGGIHRGERAVRRDGKNRISGVVNETAVAFLGLAHLAFRALALGDVFVRHDHAHRPAAAKAGDAHEKPAFLVRAVARIFQLKFFALPGDDGADAVGHRRRLLGEIAGGGIADFQIIVTNAVAVPKIVLAGKTVPRGVDFDDRPVLVENRDVGGERIKRGAQKALRFQQCAGCPFALCDVLYLGDEVKRLSLGITDERDIQQNRDELSARVDVAFLHLVGTGFTGEQAAHAFQIGGKVVGMCDVLKSACQQLGFGVADQRAGRTIDFEPATFGRDQGHADGCKLECAGEAFLAFTQHFFRALVFVHLRLQHAVGQLQFLRPLVQPRQRFRQLRAAAARGQQHEHECAKGHQAVRDSKYDGGVPDRAEAGKRRIGLCAGKLVAEFFQGVRGGIHALRLRRDVMVH